MRHFFSLLLSTILTAALLLPLTAKAEALTFAEDLTGTYVYPADVPEAEALYVYRYCYPQLAGDGDAAQVFNTTYAYTADDALAFEAPMIASGLDPDGPAMLVDITYEITCQTEDFLSVKIVKVVTSGEDISTVISGHVFALTGSRAGEIISLPYFLGILDHDETDEWYKERQTQKADSCVRDLVFAQLEEMADEGLVPLYEGLLFEELEACFYPEEDFYLDAQGDPVFFLQENAVAEAEAGVLLFPITLDELLDEI